MKRSVRDLSESEVSGRPAFVRVDYNVPVEGGRVADATRIEASRPTLRHLLDRGAKPVLASHLGRPGGRPDPRHSLVPVAAELERRLEVRVRFVAPADSPEGVEAVRSLEPGGLVLLENTRFLPGERANDDGLARRLAALGDLFVNDAFGTLHRAHASTVGVPGHLRPAVAGLLVERELEALGRVRDEPERPFVVVLGGAKIADKIDLLEAFLSRADLVLVGGAMANTFLAARGVPMGASLVEREALAAARDLAESAGSKLRLPVDLVVTPDPDARSPESRTVSSDRPIPEGSSAVDVGERTRREFAEEVRRCRTLFWNGPLGLFERPPFDQGTVELAEAAAAATAGGAFTAVGGGDSASAVRRAGVAERVSHVSTGGGAALAFLAGETLPGLEALDDRHPTGAG